MTKTLIVLLGIVSIAGSSLPFYPFASEALWPVRMVARELWPFLLAVNALGLLLTLRRGRRRLVAPLFAVGLLGALWPFLQVGGVTRRFAQQWTEQGYVPAALPDVGIAAVFANAYGGYAAFDVPPEVLPMNIHLFRAGAPAGQSARPILVHIHGGSWQHGSARAEARFASYFANRGWAVFSLEYRLAPQWRYPAQIDDVRAELAWIREHAAEYGADAERIALSGQSAGGHLAMLAAYAPDAVPVRAVVSLYGPADLAAAYRDPPEPDPLDVRRKLETFLGGTPAELPNVYRDAAPIHLLRSGLPPTLLIHGSADHITLPSLARELHRRLLAVGNHALLLELPWSDHSFDFVYFGPGSALALAYMESFLDETTRRSPSTTAARAR